MYRWFFQFRFRHDSWPVGGWFGETAICISFLKEIYFNWTCRQNYFWYARLLLLYSSILVAHGIIGFTLKITCIILKFFVQSCFFLWRKFLIRHWNRRTDRRTVGVTLSTVKVTKSSVLKVFIFEVTRSVGYDLVWKRDIHRTDWNLKRSTLGVLGVTHKRKAPRWVLFFFTHSNDDRNTVRLERPEEN